MTVCYPLTLQIDYTELKYSLRSLKFLKEPFEVVIIGDHLPEWVTGVTQIELPDIPGRKQLSIRRKIVAALEYSEEIVFMNDDCYLLYPQTEFPYYWHGYLKNYSESGSKPLMKELEHIGKETKHFDGHYNLIYERDKFKEAMEHFSADCIIKSAYCNYWNIEGTFIPDCKVLTKIKPEEFRIFIQGKNCISTGVYSVQSVLPFLQEMFPSPSKYEVV